METRNSLAIALENYRRSIVVTEDAAKSGNALARIKSIEKSAEASLALFKRDGKESVFLEKKPTQLS